jgi:hypothetical protein
VRSEGDTTTLADLRQLLLDDELRADVLAKGGLAIHAEDDNGCLEDRVVTVSRETCERVLLGNFDHLPGTTPIEELDEGVGHHHHPPAE